MRGAREFVVLGILVAIVAVGSMVFKPGDSTPMPRSSAFSSVAAASPKITPRGAKSTDPAGLLLPGWEKWRDHRSPLVADDAALAAGRDLFEKNCATCHGNEGRGDGPAGLALDPKPHDFTSVPFKYGSADWQVFRTIWEGVPETGMAMWAGRIPQRDAWVLALYVKSLSRTGRH